MVAEPHARRFVISPAGSVQSGNILQFQHSDVMPLMFTVMFERFRICGRVSERDAKGRVMEYSHPQSGGVESIFQCLGKSTRDATYSGGAIHLAPHKDLIPIVLVRVQRLVQ